MDTRGGDVGSGRGNDSGGERIVIRTAAQLLASVPPILGFVPGPGSLVAVLGDDARGRTGPVVRLDHPDLSGEADPDPLTVGAVQGAEDPSGERVEVFRDAAVAQFLADLCCRDGIRQVWLIVVQPGCVDDDEERRRVRDVIEGLMWWLESAGVTVRGTLACAGFVPGAEWVDVCSGETGTQMDPDATELAAVNVMRGRPRYADRAEIENLFRATGPAPGRVPHVGADGDAEDEGADGATGETAGDTAGGPAGEGDEPRGVRVHELAAARALAGTEPDDKELARVGGVLLEVAVRDRILVELAHRPLAERDGRRELWWAIARRRPGRERAAALCLLGSAFYYDGSGVLARAAMVESLRADPTYRLSRLMLSALDNGVRPEDIRALAG